MATMTVDRTTPMDTLLSLIGVDRVEVTRERGGVFLAPIDEPEEYDIDPDDYPDTTAYLNAIPGCAERLLASRELPRSAFKPLPKDFFDNV